MKWFHKVRLERLADKLTGEGAYAKVGPVPAHKFDMEYIFAKSRGGKSIKSKQFNPKKCNTAACALGWAANDPWFLRKGTLDEFNPKFWGTTGSQYCELFMAGSYDDGRRVKAHVVAARLRKAARTS